jgi:hypothetical protein
MATKLYTADIGNRFVEVYHTENMVDLSRMVRDESIGQIFGLPADSGINADTVRRELKIMGYHQALVSKRKDQEGREFVCVKKY